MNTNICHIFVYGTLVRGDRNHYLMVGSEYMGDYMLGDHAMYSIGGSFPGIIPADGEEVLGEVYRIDADILKSLDALEGDIYDRVPAEVMNIDSGIMLKAETYVFNRTVSQYDRVAENIWPAKNVRVMGYGSLMSSKDLLRMYTGDEKKRIRLVGNGIYKGHRLGYTYRSKGRKGGVLDVITGGTDDYVIGVVNEMPHGLMTAKIDERENNGRLYERRRITVSIDGRPVSVFCYFLLEHKRDYAGIAPHEDYDNIVLTGMAENDFPEDYIRKYKNYVRTLSIR